MQPRTDILLSATSGPAVAWTLNNSRTNPEIGSRGPNYVEQRFLLVGGAVVVNTRLGNDTTGSHSVRVYGLTEDAHAEVVELTEMAEGSDFRMEGSLRVFPTGIGLYRRVTALDGHDGPDEFCDALFDLVLKNGQTA